MVIVKKVVDEATSLVTHRGIRDATMNDSRFSVFDATWDAGDSVLAEVAEAENAIEDFTRRMRS